MQCSAVQCNAVCELLSSALQCNHSPYWHAPHWQLSVCLCFHYVMYSEVQWSAMSCSAVECYVVHCLAMQFSVLLWSGLFALQCSVLLCSSDFNNAVQCFCLCSVLFARKFSVFYAVQSFAMQCLFSFLCSSVVCYAVKCFICSDVLFLCSEVFNRPGVAGAVL